MDSSIQAIETRRNAILEEMRSIRSMKHGTINEQYFKVQLKGKKGATYQGPYYVLSRREGEKTVSLRLRSSIDLDQARKDVEAHRRFIALCREFEQLTARLGEMEREELPFEQEKKRFKSPLNKTER